MLPSHWMLFEIEKPVSAQQNVFPVSENKNGKPNDLFKTCVSNTTNIHGFR